MPCRAVILRTKHGVTLLELVIAAALVTTAVVTISLTFPKTAANLTVNRRQSLANSLASSAIQDIKSKPYSEIAVTPANAAYFTSIAAAPLVGCSCSALTDWTTLPQGATPGGYDAVYVEDGVTYTRQVCINFINRQAGNWDTYCPEDPTTPQSDRGLKYIRVRVSWPGPTGGVKFIEMETQVSR